jgi:hypothetical protein
MDEDELIPEDLEVLERLERAAATEVSARFEPFEGRDLP